MATFRIPICPIRSFPVEGIASERKRSAQRAAGERSRSNTRSSRERIAALSLLTALSACASPLAVEGPAPLPPPSVWAVRITPLPPDAGPVESIVAPTAVEAIAGSAAFARDGWVAARGAPLSPRYRIDLLGDDGSRASYWLGAGSHPPRLLCHALCSDWWIAPSNPAREIDATLYKGLPESVYQPLLESLDLR